LPKEKIRPIQHSWGRSLWDIICSEREVEVAIRSELIDFEPDIVVGRLALLPFGCYRALQHSKTFFAIKSLGSAGFVPNGWNLNQIVIRFFHPVIRTLLSRLASRAEVIDSTTNQLRSLLIKKIGARPNSIFVVSNATNTNRFTPRILSEKKESLNVPQEGIVIGYTGGDPLKRGGCEVIQLVSRLRSEGINAYGIVVGGAVPELLKLAQKHGIKGQFYAPGHVDYAEIPKWINLIDIGIALDNSVRASKIGNSYQKVRQFVACGRFIISSQIADDDPIVLCPLVVRLNQEGQEDIYLAVRHILGLPKEKRIERQIEGRAFAEKHLSLGAALETRIKLWKSFLALKSSDRAQCN
jgi:hypothetical protein